MFALVLLVLNQHFAVNGQFNYCSGPYRDLQDNVCSIEGASPYPTIQCPEDYDCIVACGGDWACYQKSITCPPNGKCNINCEGILACGEIDITLPDDDSLFNLTFTGPSVLWGVTFPITPVDDFQNLTLICDSNEICGGMNITCPKYGRCDILCLADQACIEMTISWPDEIGLGSIACEGYRACRYVNLPPFNPFQPLTLSCGSNECEIISITCPQYAECNIYCQGDYSCFYADIIWPEIPGLGNLVCDGPGACWHVRFPMPKSGSSMTVNCQYSHMCDDAKIFCPANGRCDIECSAPHACANASIYCPSSAECSVACTWAGACGWLKLYSADMTENPFNLTCDRPFFCESVEELSWTSDYTAAPTADTTSPASNPTSNPTVSPIAELCPYRCTEACNSCDCDGTGQALTNSIACNSCQNGCSKCEIGYKLNTITNTCDEDKISCDEDNDCADGFKCDEDPECLFYTCTPPNQFHFTQCLPFTLKCSDVAGPQPKFCQAIEYSSGICITDNDCNRSNGFRCYKGNKGLQLFPSNFIAQQGSGTSLGGMCIKYE